MSPSLRLLAGLALALAAIPAVAQRDSFDSLPSTDEINETIRNANNAFKRVFVSRSLYANSPQVRSAFRPVIADIRQATVQVRVKKRRVAYGGIVGPDGWILTKASLLREPLTCRLRDGRELDARLVGVDRETDLAMLKVSATGLPTLDLGKDDPVAEAEEDGASADDEEPADEFPLSDPMQPGDLLATVGLGRDPIAVGVLSVLPRPIAKRRGFLGVEMDLEYEPPEGAPAAVRITGVRPNSAAAEAGLKKEDLVLSADGVNTPDVEALRSVIGGRNPGDRVDLELLRGDEKLRLRAILHGWFPNPAERRAYYQNNLGGKLSERRFGFPAALQHDTTINADKCGGPVVDLSGRVVGFNIARAGRTETYALPTELVCSKLLDLMSGQLAPDDPE